MEDSRNSTSRPITPASKTRKISVAPYDPLITPPATPPQADSMKKQFPCRPIFILLGVVGASVLLASAVAMGVLLGMDGKTSKIESGKPESC